MIIPSKKDAIHKAWLYRLLRALCDYPNIPQKIHFKGGTCAAMLGYLDRFSIDLDFDLDSSALEEQGSLRKDLRTVFNKLGLVIKDESRNIPQFFLKYQAPEGERNTIKVEINNEIFKSSRYEVQYLKDINRHLSCQTAATMFAHKLVALTNRYKKHKTVAGRDVYDIHRFFLNGMAYESGVIKERTGLETKKYFQELVSFIQENVTRKVIEQDLNPLLPYDKFAKMREYLKEETIGLIEDEIERLARFATITAVGKPSGKKPESHN